MASDAWRPTTLGEVLELKRGYDLPSRDRRDGPYPIVSSSGISGYHAEAMVKGPGVVTGRYGTIGQVFYIPQDFWPLNTSLYVRDFKGNDPRFVSYFLRTLNFLAYSDKAAVPGLNRNHLHMAEVIIPPIPEQKAIAAVLGAFDDKIEVNRRVSRTLEAAARALFESWFVRFEYPAAKVPAPRLVDSAMGAIPEGWKVRPLDTIARFLNGLALQKFPPGDGEPTLPVIKIAQLRQGDTMGADQASTEIASDYVVSNGDMLFSWSGSLECVLWAGGSGALNQHLFKVTSTEFPQWFVYLWVKHHLPQFRHIAAAKATTMGHIQRHHLTNALVAVPPANVLTEMGRVLEPMIEAIPHRMVEARTLAALRDALLPRLISGELPTAMLKEAAR